MQNTVFGNFMAGRNLGLQDRARGLSGMVMNSQDQSQRKSYLAELAGIDPSAARTFQSEFDEKDKADFADWAGTLVNVAPELQPKVYEAGVARFGEKFRRMGIEPPQDYKQALPAIQQWAGVGQADVPADVRSNQWYLQQLGYKPGSEEERNFLRMRAGQMPKAVPYGFKYDEQGNVWVEDKNQGEIRPGQFGGQNPPPQAGGVAIGNPVAVQTDNEAPVDFSTLPADEQQALTLASQAAAQGKPFHYTVKGGVVAPATPQQARIGVKPEVPKAPDAPSGYRFRPDGGLEAIPGGPADTAAKPKKPWPTAALKVYGTMSGDLQVADTLDTMMADMEALFNDPKFELGPIQNRQYELANWSGQSSPQSRAYAKLAANFEKMRNDSLRLNKGVQTDGDAQRAWNEIMANMNDKELVMARLADIKRYNDFALAEKQYQLEVFEEQYGKPNAIRKEPGADSGAPVKVSTKQQYDALPSGTEYIGPDGKKARKK